MSPTFPADDAESTPDAAVIRLATVDDLGVAAPLFDAYRQFYGQAADSALANRFLRERLAREESLFLLACSPGGQGLGFAQLYPSFSSVACRPILILNDLFVSPEARGGGVAKALLNAAAQLGRRRGAARLVLETAQTNRRAQALYEAFGFVRSTEFLTYSMAIDGTERP